MLNRRAFLAAAFVAPVALATPPDPDAELIAAYRRLIDLDEQARRWAETHEDDEDPFLDEWFNAWELAAKLPAVTAAGMAVKLGLWMIEARLGESSSQNVLISSTQTAVEQFFPAA